MEPLAASFGGAPQPHANTDHQGRGPPPPPPPRGAAFGACCCSPLAGPVVGTLGVGLAGDVARCSWVRANCVNADASSSAALPWRGASLPEAEVRERSAWWLRGALVARARRGQPGRRHVRARLEPQIGPPPPLKLRASTRTQHAAATKVTHHPRRPSPITSDARSACTALCEYGFGRSAAPPAGCTSPWGSPAGAAAAAAAIRAAPGEGRRAVAGGRDGCGEAARCGLRARGCRSAVQRAAAHTPPNVTSPDRGPAGPRAG